MCIRDRRSPRSPTMFRTSLARIAGPLRRAAEVEAAASPKLQFSFLLPHKPLFQNAMVDQVTIPGSTGEFAVLKGHQQTIEDLQAGVVEVVNDGERSKYFVSGGFAFVHADKTTIAAVEAVDIGDLDSAAVEKGLAEAQAALAAAQDEDARIAGQVAVDTHRAMQYAISKN
eukprot:TRINITY_DN10741_c0_g1_i1.p1 TRINITY_DN10741_c0_g1~~TRINITY_DN10741_c0_g1_i1.p1  ORF type:complete len:171 (+),score=52.01 TRINITY_DN10741_c0_g1_i1:132-644(+)